MAEYSVIYSHRDENGDRLRVECWPETIEVDAEDANGKDRASVSLPREEGIKLARAILAALGKDDDGAYTPEGLESLPEGVEVQAEDGYTWVKNPDGAWHCPLDDVYAGSTLLVKNYGPITAKDGVCSSRHADKTETGDTP